MPEFLRPSSRWRLGLAGAVIVLAGWGMLRVSGLGQVPPPLPPTLVPLQGSISVQPQGGSFEPVVGPRILQVADRMRLETGALAIVRWPGGGETELGSPSEIEVIRRDDAYQSYFTLHNLSGMGVMGGCEFFTSDLLTPSATPRVQCGVP